MSTRANGLAITADSPTSSTLSAQNLPDSIGLTVTRDAKSAQAAAPAGSPGQTNAFAPAASSATSVANSDNPNLQLFANGTPQGPGSNQTQATGTPVPSTTAAASSATQTPSPTTTATPATNNCDTTQSSLYCVYTVQGGDTLSGIASKFSIHGNDDVEPWELIMNSNKPDITAKDDILQIDQKIRVPTSSAALAAASAETSSTTSTPSASSSTPTAPSTVGSVIHTVLKAETISDIADEYDVTSAAIVAANKLSNPDALQIGQELLIPNPKQFAKPEPVVAPVAAPSPTASGSSDSSSSSGSTASPATVPVGPKSQAGFVWPVGGPISSYFGPAHPLGIDIDLFASPNAPVGAVAAGTVTFAGGNSCCSYGYYVIVDHGNGFQTLYAHFSAIKVSVGQKVSQGTVLGLGGRTGYATGNHLHFEVHLNGNIVNPLSYLP